MSQQSFISKFRYYTKEGDHLQYVDSSDYQTRIYSVSELSSLLERAGWKVIRAYENIQTSAITRYVLPDNVIMYTSDARMDMAWGAIPPPIGGVDPSIARFLPSRVSSSMRREDFYPHVWIDETRENLHLGIKCRPIAIPTDINSFGTLDTTY